jgi:hypothetical protein
MLTGVAGRIEDAINHIGVPAQLPKLGLPVPSDRCRHPVLEFRPFLIYQRTQLRIFNRGIRQIRQVS